MRARILVVSKTPPRWLREQCDTYAKRVLPPWQLVSEYLPQSRFYGKDDARAVREDNDRLLAASKGDIRIAMDKSGRVWSSEGLSQWLQSFAGKGRLSFLVGGPLGFDANTLAACDYTISLSQLTLPHALAHLVLCEQLYRSNAIARQSGYHK